VSFYLIGVSFWAWLTVVMVASAVAAAVIEATSRRVRHTLGNHVDRLREQYEHASAAFHDPLPSSPSHPSFPPQL
jgi:hypothetical protein